MFNISFRRRGAMRFLKVGRLTFTFCLAKAYRPLKSTT